MMETVGCLYAGLTGFTILKSKIYTPWAVIQALKRGGRAEEVQGGLEVETLPPQSGNLSFLKLTTALST